MVDPTPELLSAVLVDVLAETAFACSEPDPELPAWPSGALGAALAFDAERRGVLHLAVGREGAAELAAGMLGLDAADGAAAVDAPHAVAEILNVLGGALLACLFGAEVPSRLGLPRAEPPFRAARGCAAVVRIDSGAPVALLLDLEEP